ncbi:TatD DNase family protein [Ekhidna lutea]|uniref:TatD DNase family protein n=1 Tax=Ekhidna lutea TaxID=447679 RepID=A0A239HJC4_EKHLU|nr:TatD family hydrolase [Ekhidna lutea]SNS81231.1 TatD DNase family protein [Ekhidna lutea]
MIDTHAHIYLEHFDEDRDAVIERALEKGVKRILLPNIDSTSIDSMLALEEKYPDICYPMMGLHPCSVKEDFEKELQLVEEWLNKRKFLAIGEMGTDLYWDKTFWEQQKEAFRFQCDLALKHELPIVIHCRETIDETIDLVAEYEGKGLRGVFHCFTGSVDQGKKITDFGFYMGLGGVSTFKNGGMDQVIPHLDRTKIILETDSPYLTPAPHRGKRNEPAYTSIIAEKVASYLELSKEAVDELTTANANALFFPSEK